MKKYPRTGLSAANEDVVPLDELDDGGRFGGPEVLEAAEVGVLAAGKQTVEILGEDGEVAVRVVDASVVVVRHCDGERDLYLRVLGRQGQAVDEGVVGVLVGAQEEAPLGTATGDHVVTAGHDLAGDSHAWVLGNRRRSCMEEYPRRGIAEGDCVGFRNVRLGRSAVFFTPRASCRRPGGSRPPHDLRCLGLVRQDLASASGGST